MSFSYYMSHKIMNKFHLEFYREFIDHLKWTLGENYTNMTYKVEKLSSKLYLKCKYKKIVHIYIVISALRYI